MDSERNEIEFRVNGEEVIFQASKGIKLPHAYESISSIDVFDEIEDTVAVNMEKECLGETLVAILVNFDGEVNGRIRGIGECIGRAWVLHLCTKEAFS